MQWPLISHVSKYCLLVFHRSELFLLAFLNHYQNIHWPRFKALSIRYRLLNHHKAIVYDSDPLLTIVNHLLSHSEPLLLTNHHQSFMNPSLQPSQQHAPAISSTSRLRHRGSALRLRDRHRFPTDLPDAEPQQRVRPPGSSWQRPRGSWSWAAMVSSRIASMPGSFPY